MSDTSYHDSFAQRLIHDVLAERPSADRDEVWREVTSAVAELDESRSVLNYARYYLFPEEDHLLPNGELRKAVRIA